VLDAGGFPFTEGMKQFMAKPLTPQRADDDARQQRASLADCATPLAGFFSSK